MSQNETQLIRSSQLVEMSPFSVDYSSAVVVTKVARSTTRKYVVVRVTVNPLGLTEESDKKQVELFSNEYKSIVALGFDLEGIVATPTLNQKTGAVTNIYSPFRSK